MYREFFKLMRPEERKLFTNETFEEERSQSLPEASLKERFSLTNQEADFLIFLSMEQFMKVELKLEGSSPGQVCCDHQAPEQDSSALKYEIADDNPFQVSGLRQQPSFDENFHFRQKPQDAMEPKETTTAQEPPPQEVLCVELKDQEEPPPQEVMCIELEDQEEPTELDTTTQPLLDIETNKKIEIRPKWLARAVGCNFFACFCCWRACFPPAAVLA